MRAFGILVTNGSSATILENAITGGAAGLGGSHGSDGADGAAGRRVEYLKL